METHNNDEFWPKCFVSHSTYFVLLLNFISSSKLGECVYMHDAKTVAVNHKLTRGSFMFSSSLEDFDP